jgi:alpha-N-arabinofuranosidase
MTSADSVLRQTIYYPYAWALKHANGRVIDLQVESETYPIRATGLRADFARDDKVPYLDVVVTVDAKQNRAAAFMLNRDLDSPRELVLRWHDPTPAKVLSCQTLTGSDPKATNTFEQPKKVMPHSLDAPEAAAKMTFKLPAASYSVAEFSLS